jgi:hypothetical protein
VVTAADHGVHILKKALSYGPLARDPEWFNDDEHFAQVMQQTLSLQTAIVSELQHAGLPSSRLAPELASVTLKGWQLRGPARVLLLAGWVLTRTSTVDVSIDLRDCEISPTEAEELAALLTAVPKLTALDLRGNESIGERGIEALEDFMSKNGTSFTHAPRSICGVNPHNSRLDVPHTMFDVEKRLYCAELLANVWAEGVSAGMGTSKSKNAASTTQLNRRGAAMAADWQPLL